jgi:N-acyl-D-amino-acid deacylase
VFDLIVRGGWVCDGTGAPPARLDVGVSGSRIAALGRLDDAAAGTTVDAAGRYVLPGFIDAHAHAEAAVLDPAMQLAALRQGVTTVIVGQDGLSYAPATPDALRYVSWYFAGVNGVHPALDHHAHDGAPVSVADLLDTWRGTTPLNTACLIPHGTIRFGVLGPADRPPDDAELREMGRMVESGLADGAVGLSTGLEYLPGRLAAAEEIAALCRPVASAGLPYVTHMRGYGLTAPSGMAEVCDIARAAGVAAHVSHYHGPAESLVPLVDDARDRGLDLTFDSYPYLRGCTILAMVALPHWLDATDADRAIAALSDEGVRRRIADAADPTLWPRITLAHVPHPEWAWTEGRTVVDAAEETGRQSVDVCLELLVATRLTATAVFEHPRTTTDESLRALLRHPVHMGGSDGIYVGGHPHPRGWGAFARYLRRHVRELGDWTWEQAAVHLAGHPARRFALLDRGLIRPGQAADLAVIDPFRVADRADYATPREPAVGVDDVIVNGVPVLRDSQLTGALAGLPLKPYQGA